jgi:nucleoside-diphosphate-sugar epimerase
MSVDLRDITAEHCADFDAVVHLAALSNDPVGNLRPEMTYDINYHATVRLAKAAKAAGVPRLLFSSSCSLYGAAAANDEPLDESAAMAPITPYGESKVLSEQGLSELADDNFTPVYLRNATAYGFSPRLRGDIVVNDFTAYALLTGEVRLLSDGKAWRPLIHAEDIAAAFVALLEAPRDVVHNKAYNVCQTQENYLIRDVAELVAQVVPGSRLSFADGGGTDLRNYRVSGDLIAAEVPSFKPQWTVRTGVEQLVEAYRRYGLTIEDFAGERYQRIKRIRALQAAGRLDDTLRWCTA